MVTIVVLMMNDVIKGDNRLKYYVQGLFEALNYNETL